MAFICYAKLLNIVNTIQQLITAAGLSFWPKGAVGAVLHSIHQHIHYPLTLHYHATQKQRLIQVGTDLCMSSSTTCC